MIELLIVDLDCGVRELCHRLLARHLTKETCKVRCLSNVCPMEPRPGVDMDGALGPAQKRDRALLGQGIYFRLQEPVRGNRHQRHCGV